MSEDRAAECERLADYVGGYADYIEREAPDQYNESVAKFRRAAELLRTASSAPAPSEQRETWQPIESAPKDGTGILGADMHDGEMTVMWWRKGDWYEFMNYECRFEPTHWMPLPAPPGKPEPGRERGS